MKRISYVFIFLAFLSGFIFSCKEDEPEVFVPEEDSTMWDYKLEYPVNITVSEVSYDGVQVNIDLDAIAGYLKITREDLLLSIADSIDDPDVTLYAIGGPATDEVEVGTAANTNGQWGHWWDANGVNCEWGDAAMIFAEFYAENEYFSIGQYPAHLTVGQVIKFYECIKYNDIKVALEFTVTAIPPEEVKAEIVNTQNLSMSMPASATYDADSVKFDLAQAITDLGITSMNEVTLVGVMDDGSFAQEKSADEGYWMDKEGIVTTWGNGSVAYSAYNPASNSSYIRIGQFPDTLVAGETITAKLGFLANDKIEMIKITINITEAEVISAQIVNTQQLSISVDTVADYSADTLQFNMAQTLTDLGISSMSEIESVVTYDLDGTITNVTATGNDFWYDLDGNYGSWGDNASVYVTWGAFADDYIGIGQFPGNLAAKVGNTYTVNYGFMANNKVEMLEIAVTLTSAK